MLQRCLEAALEKGHAPTCTLLRMAGATLAEETKPKLATRLVMAAGRAEKTTVQLLLEAGMPVNAVAPCMVLEGHSGQAQFAMGVYALDGESGGRPSYKQEGKDARFLYFVAEHGMWFVGPEKGGAAGCIVGVEPAGCASPDLVGSWEVAMDGDWSVDEALQCRMVSFGEWLGDRLAWSQPQRRRALWRAAGVAKRTRAARTDTAVGFCYCLVVLGHRRHPRCRRVPQLRCLRASAAGMRARRAYCWTR